MASIKVSRFQSLLKGPAWVARRVRALPWLVPALALGGVALWFFLTVRDVLDLGDERHVAAHVKFAENAEGAGDLYFEFFREHWLLAAKCLSPALLCALIRRRRGRLALPVTLLCGWLATWWLGHELHANLARALRDPLGMTPAPEAYYVKLALMVFLIMSVPLLLLLYYKASILDRYVVRNFAVPFLLCLGGIAGIMITMDLLNHANDFVDAKFSLGKVGKFYLVQLPQILVTITEAALLLSTLYSLGRMSRYNELVSMLTAGRGLTRVLMPVLVFGGWCSLAVLALNYQLAPQAERTKEEMLKDTSKKNASNQAGVEYNVSYRNREDRRFWLINRMPYDLADGNPMRDVWVVQQDENGDPKWLIVAQKVKWNPYTRGWQFESATVMDFAPGLVERGRTYWEKYANPEPWRETPGSILSDKLNPEYLGVPELVAYLRTNHSLPEKNLAKYEATKHWRFAMPFRCFLLVLLAAPLGITTSRRGLLGGVASAVGLFMGVYFLSTVVLKAGEGLYIPPVAGAWAVNAAALVAGLYMLWKKSSNRSFPWPRRAGSVAPVPAPQPARAAAS